MKIVIDGMDGTGKSTVAKIVADRLGAKYVDGLLVNYFQDRGFSEDEISVIRKAVDAFSDDQNSIVRTWIFGFANIFNLLHYDCDLVIDRHSITTFYYNGDEVSSCVYKFMQKISGKPDFVFLLRASKETRVARICARNCNDPDLSIKMKMAYGYDKMEEAAQFLELNCRIIDTDGKTAEQVADELIGRIKG